MTSIVVDVMHMEEVRVYRSPLLINIRTFADACNCREN